MANRDIGVFLRDIIKKAPKPFPYIAIFHVLWGIMILLFNWGDPIDLYIVDLLWIIGFTVCWFYICDLKRWAANGYLLLTLANIVTFTYISLAYESWDKKDALWDSYISTLIIPALVFSFLVLFFYRRLDQK